MSLGKKLKSNIDLKEAAKRAAAEHAKQLELKRVQDLVDECQKYFDKLVSDITYTIENGGVPTPYKMPRVFNDSSWMFGNRSTYSSYINGAFALSNEKHPAHQNYNQFVTWAWSVGLNVIITHEHDGSGIDSWWSCKVEPA